MMRELDYQARVLATFDNYLIELLTAKKKADAIEKLKRSQPDLDLEVPDFAQRAWEAMRSSGYLPISRHAVPFSPRRDGLGRSVPDVVIKVPTGGGKTYLAVSMLSRIF